MGRRTPSKHFLIRTHPEQVGAQSPSVNYVAQVAGKDGVGAVESALASLSVEDGTWEVWCAEITDNSVPGLDNAATTGAFRYFKADVRDGEAQVSVMTFSGEDGGSWAVEVVKTDTEGAGGVRYADPPLSDDWGERPTK